MLPVHICYMKCRMKVNVKRLYKILKVYINTASVFLYNDVTQNSPMEIIKLRRSFTKFKDL